MKIKYEKATREERETREDTGGTHERNKKSKRNPIHDGRRRKDEEDRRLRGSF